MSKDSKVICEIVNFHEQPSAELMKLHREFLSKLGKKGMLMMSGRFVDKQGSLIIWKLNSVEEARKIALSDPYFEKGITTFILREWNILWDFTITPPKTQL